MIFDILVGSRNPYRETSTNGGEVRTEERTNRPTRTRSLGERYTESKTFNSYRRNFLPVLLF